MLIFRPMIWRELLRESRHWTHFAGRALIALVLGAIVLDIGLSQGGSGLSSMPFVGVRRVLFPTGVYYGVVPTRAMVPFGPSPPTYVALQANMAEMGRQLFTLWAVGQYIALCALATLRAASLAEERRRDRLPLLTITGLGARGVIVGAYASILVRALITMLLMLPILALARGFGGFTVEQACMAAGIAFVAAATAAALTLALASFVSGTAAAVVLSAIAQAILLAVFHTSSAYAVIGRNVTLMKDLSHSYGLLGYVLQGTSLPWDVLASFVFYRVLLCYLCLKLATVRIQRAAPDAGRHLKRLLTAMDRYFLDFSGAGGGQWVLWKSGLGECRGSPIYWRERAISVVGQRDHLIRVLYGAGILLAVGLGVALVAGWTQGGTSLVVLGVIGVPLLIGGLLMLVQPALAFAREKERGGLAALVLTPMTPWQFVMGKYWYALRSVAVPLGVGLGFALLVGSFAFAYGTENAHLGYLSLLILMTPLAVALVLYVSAGAQSAVSGILGGLAALIGLALVLLPGFHFAAAINGTDYVLQHDLLARMVGRCCSTLLLLCSFLAAPYSKWMRNGLVIALFVLVPAALGDIGQRWGNGSFYMLCAIALALAAYLGIRLRKARFAWALVLALLVSAAEGQVPIFIFHLSLFLACWQAARYAGAGVLNRALVAVMLIGAARAALPLPLGIPLAAGGVIAFLFFTVRQFDQLVERNG